MRLESHNYIRALYTFKPLQFKLISTNLYYISCFNISIKPSIVNNFVYTFVHPYIFIRLIINNSSD